MAGSAQDILIRELKDDLNLLRQLNLFDEAENESDFTSPDDLQQVTVAEHTRQKRATHADMFKGIKVNPILVPLEEGQDKRNLFMSG